VKAAQLQDAVAGFGGIMEAVVGAGEAFIVVDHQVGAELVVALADGFESLASYFMSEFPSSGTKEGGGEGKCVEAVRGRISDEVKCRAAKRVGPRLMHLRLERGEGPH
jgi:hypothetical protein